MIEGNRLSRSARDALIYIASQLSGEFTGEIRIRCERGGVRSIHFEKRLTAEEFSLSGHDDDLGVTSRHPDP